MMKQHVFKDLLIFLVLMVAGCSQQQEYQDINGKRIARQEYLGKYIILNYWASWCIPCRTEIPELNAFYLAHKDKDAIVFGINFDHLPKEQLLPIIKKFAIAYPVLAQDPATKLGIATIPGLPATFIISPAGKIVTELYGAQTRQRLEAAIAKNN